MNKHLAQCFAISREYQCTEEHIIRTMYGTIQRVQNPTRVSDVEMVYTFIMNMDHIVLYIVKMYTISEHLDSRVKIFVRYLGVGFRSGLASGILYGISKA